MNNNTRDTVKRIEDLKALTKVSEVYTKEYQEGLKKLRLALQPLEDEKQRLIKLCYSHLKDYLLELTQTNCKNPDSIFGKVLLEEKLDYKTGQYNPTGRKGMAQYYGERSQALPYDEEAFQELHEKKYRYHWGIRVFKKNGMPGTRVVGSFFSHTLESVSLDDTRWVIESQA